MTRPMMRRSLAIALVALLQVAVVLSLVLRQENRLEAGRDLYLSVVPVDPRDVLRGDYVILSYAIERPGPDVPVLGQPQPGATVWLILRLMPDHRVAGIDRIQTTPDGAPGAGHLALRALWQGEGRLDLPDLGRYFVPEGTGRALEEAIRAGAAEAHLKVAPDGSAVLRDVVVKE